jgi:LPXTG-motif cell wall-anchored protein
MVAALSVVGTSAASASGDDQQCGDLAISYSVDGGNTWTQNPRMDGGPGPKTVAVKLKGDIAEGCSYDVSLASYRTEGPDWKSSGAQAFLAYDTGTLTPERTQITLDVSSGAPFCFGQIDLYNGSTKYDGTGGALPHYPDSATPFGLISAWNGGAPCATPTPTGTGSPTPTGTGTPTPTATGSASPTPTGTGTPTATGSASPTPSVADTSSPSPTPSTTTPAGGSGSVTPPTGSPVVKPVSVTPAGNLAETGGNGSQTVAFAGGGAALLVIGGGAVYFTRRRNRATN